MMGAQNTVRWSVFGLVLASIAAAPAAAQPVECQWAPLGLGLTEGFSPPPDAMHVYDDGTGPALFVAGFFLRAGGQPASGVAKWDGSAWSDLDGGTFFGGPQALQGYDDGTGPALYAAGEFFEAGGRPIEKIARWTPVGGWEEVGGGLDAGGGFALALATFDDGTGAALYVGGIIDAAGGVPVNNIARWDGTQWTDVGGGVSGTVDAMTVFDDGSGPALYVSGRITAAGGEPVNGIAKWDGTQWMALGPGLRSDDGTTVVSSLTIYDDGAGPTLVAGGKFDRTGDGGVTDLHNIARWDGSTWSPLGDGVVGWSDTLVTVQAMTVFDDGDGDRLYVGGYFLRDRGGPGDNLAAWDGRHWSEVGDGLEGTVFSLDVFDSGDGPQLVAGGSFTEVDG